MFRPLEGTADTFYVARFTVVLAKKLVSKVGYNSSPVSHQKKLEKKTKKTTPNTKNNSARRSSPRKTVHLDPKFERITSITQQQDLDLKQAFATLFNSYENKQVVECFTTQKEILELCLRLKDAIQNNFDKETNPPKGTREGFNVTYSKAMGYHSKTGKVRLVHHCHAMLRTHRCGRKGGECG